MCFANKVLLLILLLLKNFVISQEEPNRIITLFVKEYPEINTESRIAELINCGSLNIPFKLGIYSSYHGYLNLTNQDGQLIFPRKTLTETLNLLITPFINPVFMFKNTIAFWKIDKDVIDESLLEEDFLDSNDEIKFAKMYKIEKKQDPDTQMYLWEVKKRNIPKNNQIPLHTIIIFMDPQFIDIPEGVTITTNNPQLILPTIYVKRNIGLQKSIFAINKIKPFFSSLKKLYKERPLGYASHITN